jgi:hypothetical protein
MSKPPKPTTNENDTSGKPDAKPRIVGKWVLPDNFVIVERPGETFALVGPPMRPEPSTEPDDPAPDPVKAG